MSPRRSNTSNVPYAKIRAEIARAVAAIDENNLQLTIQNLERALSSAKRLAGDIEITAAELPDVYGVDGPVTGDGLGYDPEEKS